MKNSVHDSKLFLIAENEADQAILLEIWQHPLITEIKIPHFRYGIRDYRAELVCSEPLKKEIKDGE